LRLLARTVRRPWSPILTNAVPALPTFNSVVQAEKHRPPSTAASVEARHQIVPQLVTGAQTLQRPRSYPCAHHHSPTGPTTGQQFRESDIKVGQTPARRNRRHRGLSANPIKAGPTATTPRNCPL